MKISPPSRTVEARNRPSRSRFSRLSHLDHHHWTDKAAITGTSQTCHGRKGQRKLVHTLFAEEVARVELFLGSLEARLLLLDIILNTRMIIL